MIDNDNSVNIAPPRGYHHGDLRAALIAAGLEMLDERSVEDISLRELARRVGVSATAVYRHFPDKRALLAALAAEGVEALGRRQRAASAKAGGGLDGFVASGSTYVAFAIEHPTLFRLIFAHAPSVGALDVAVDKAGIAMRGLREDIEALSPPGTPEPVRKATALRAWAMVHGLAMLVLDRQIADDRALIEQAIRDCDLA